MKRTICAIAAAFTMSLTAVQATNAAYVAKKSDTKNVTNQDVTRKVDASISSNGHKTFITLNLGHIDGSLETDGVILVIDGKVHKPLSTKAIESNGEKYLRFAFDRLKHTDGAALSFMLNGKTRVLKIRESGAEEIIASGVTVR